MSHIIRRAMLGGVCAIIVVLTAAGAFAAFVPKVGYSAKGSDAVVTVNDCEAIRFRVSNGGLSPLERARITAGRLDPLARGGWKSLTYKTEGGQKAKVMAGSQLICIATAQDAKANKTTAGALARQWSGNLRRLFAMPPLSLSPAGLTVPEGETRRTTVGGAVSGPVNTAVSDPSIASSTFDAKNRVVIVTGKAVGQCTVEVSRGGYTQKLAVKVKRYAGSLSEPGSAEVTGNPAPDWLLAVAAEQAAHSAIKLEPNATISVGKAHVKGKSLQPGKSMRLFVPVVVRGPNLLTANISIPVDLFNRLTPTEPPTTLFYSNNPEQITRYGTLFTGLLTVDEGCRLFYHHQNMLGKRVRFAIELINAGNTPARVLAIASDASPNKDTVGVGYKAGATFMREYLRRAGLIRQIPPRSRLITYTADLEQSVTVSGIIDLHPLESEELFVRINALPPASSTFSEGNIAAVNDAYIPAELSDHVYTAPAKQLEARYVIGERWEFIRIGKQAIPGVVDERQLSGNYGVIYEIHVRAENPTSDDQIVHIVFEPSAGPAAGLFVVGGKIVGSKMIAPPKEFNVASVRVPAGQSKQVTLLTMPLGGSAYPATIVVRPTISPN